MGDSRRGTEGPACGPVVRPFFRATLFTAIGVGFLGSAAIVLADDAVNHQAWSDRPFELGVSGSSIEHIFDFPRIYCYAGTLGSLVTDGTDDYILSNNHVLAKENDPDNSSLDPDGRNIIQAGLLDEGTCSLSLGDPNNIVGYLTAYVPLQFGKGKNPPENKVDAAIAVTNETVAMVASDGSIRDVGPLTGAPETANVGDQVHKSGRTTGHTFGEVAAINVTIKVKYMSGTALFVDQIEATGLCDTQFSDSGDSGSLIVTLRDGAPRAPVGLLFAGGGASTFANPIDTVLSKMGAQANLTLSMVVGGTGNVNDVTDNTEIPSCSAGGGSVTAADDSYKLPKKNTVLTVAAPGILENDTGFVGSAVVVSGPSVGVGNLTFGGDGGFTYEYIGADRNGDGSDSFVYEVTDGANFATATVTINLASKGGGRPSGAGSGSAGLEHALQVRADHEDELFDIPGVWGSGIGADASGNPVIRVYVESAAQSVDHPIPADIEGLPVQIVVTGPIQAY